VAVGVSSEKNMGRRLREARLARALDLNRAAEETRIHRRFLEALERDAPPEEFPAPMYARAFLREYARYLGLDPEPLVASYQMNHLVRERPIRPPMPIERSSAAWVGTILAMVSVVALLILAMVAGRQEERPVPRVASPPASPSPSPPAVAGERTGRQPPKAVILEIRIDERPSWIQVVRDGEIILKKTLEPGTERTFRDRRRLDLIVGDAGAVRVTLNGKRMGPLGGDGQVFTGSAIFEKGKARLVRAEA
jgi:cytoskeleton protein RodZ